MQDPLAQLFGTLRRPRLRNIPKPDGFDPSDPLTADHNILARRAAMVGAIAVRVFGHALLNEPLPELSLVQTEINGMLS